MKKMVLFVFAVFIMSSCSEAQQVDNDVINKNVTVQEFKQLMDKENVQLVDVRTPAEYESGKIGDASNVDFLNANFETEISKLDKNLPTLIYCAAGSRSDRAATLMKELGFQEVYNLEGGYNRWPEK